jgi:LuxR family maltose regulon positive regulatory protein
MYQKLAMSFEGSTEESAVILDTKLRVPQQPGFSVARELALARLDSLLEKTLTLVVAPAGFGKTVTLSQWVQRYASPVVWLSLEKADAQPLRLLHCLNSALHVFDPEVFPLTPLPLMVDQRTRNAYFTNLLNKLAAYSEPVIAVLDDYHAVETDELSSLLGHLLRQFPDNVHMVISSRYPPNLAFSRLRAQGQLLELGVHELGFTPDETIRFFQQTGHSCIEKPIAQRFCKDTGGWPAGLQLIALSGKDVFERDVAEVFQGSQDFVSQYLLEEVLADLDVNIQQFLIKTSILELLSAPLCAHILQMSTDDAMRALKTIQTHNLFITELHESAGLFSYHQVFSKALKLLLDTMYPQELPLLFCRAVDWYEDNRMYEQAIRLATESQDLERAVDLFVRNRHVLIFMGDTGMLAQWLTYFPPALVDATPALGMAQGFVLGMMGQLSESLGYFGRALKLLIDTDSTFVGDDMRKSLLGEIHALTAFVLASNKHPKEASYHCDEALGCLTEDQRYLREMVLQTKTSIGLDEDYYATYEKFARLVETQASTKSRNMLCSALCNLARFQRNMGLLDAAEKSLSSAVALYPENPNIPMLSSAYLDIGLLNYERNRLSDAKRYLQACFQAGEYLRMPTAMAVAYLRLGCIAQEMGDANVAQELFAQAFAIDRDCWLEISMSLPLFTTLLKERKLPAELIGTSRTCADEFLSTSPTLLRSLHETSSLLLAAMSYLYDGKHKQVTEIVDRLIAHLFEGYQYQRISALILRALALDAQGFIGAATESLLSALELGSKQRYLRVYLDWGSSLIDLIKRCLACPGALRIDPAFRSTLLFAFNDMARAGDGVVRQQVLTEREVSLLRLLSDGLSTKQIATHLSISYETVRTHLSNIYGKLDAHSKIQALNNARSMRII